MHLTAWMIFNAIEAFWNQIMHQHQQSAKLEDKSSSSLLKPDAYAAGCVLCPAARTLWPLIHLSDEVINMKQKCYSVFSVFSVSNPNGFYPRYSFVYYGLKEYFGFKHFVPLLCVV